MAELAAGAVSSLLVVIRNERALLGGVHGDVQFIKEEMESMSSFLVHLARTAPPGGEHDEQVRTWMNQVRLLAQDCNNCLDLYLYRGNPEIHRARGGLRRYLWWVPWFLQKLVAQHRAAIQLRQLKERAQHVGERRLRYGVSIPAKSVPGQQSPPEAGLAAPSSSAQAATSAAADDVDGTGDDEEDGGGVQLVAVATTTTEQYFGPRAFFQPGTLDDYVKAKLLQWIKEIHKGAVVTLSLAIVAPNADQEALALAYETLVHPPEYDRGVLVDITVLHYDFLPLRPKDVLYYILREIEQEQSMAPTPHQGIGFRQASIRKWDVYCQKKMALRKIKDKIQEMMVHEKLEKIKKEIQLRPMNGSQLQQLLQRDFEQKKGVDKLDLHAVFQLLLAASQHDQVMKTKDMHKLSAWYDDIVTKLAKKLKKYMEEKATNLKEYMEANDKVTEGRGGDAVVAGEAGGDAAAAAAAGGGGGGDAAGTTGEEANEEEDDDDNGDDQRQQKASICLPKSEYEQILREVFPNPRSHKVLQAHQQDGSSAAKQSTKTTKATLDEDQVKQMIHEAKEEILREVQQGKADKNQTTEEPDGPGPKSKADTEGMDQKIEKLKKETKEKLKIKGLVDEIKHHLKEDIPLFILKIDEMIDGFRWEDTRNALSLLKCSADALIFTTTNDIERARGFCYPRREPIDYSPVGLYHDTVLALTSRQKNEDNYNTRIFRDILEECRPHEFCMKMFTHAFYANPKKSIEELLKLHSTLQALPLPKSLNLVAKKMFKFSYNDLPKEYKSCLLYLAIFPPEHKIRRSTLVGRWVMEGLIFHDDWPNSVHWANRCFDELINQWLVYPRDIGATGKVKSCMVGDLIHGFITKVARKQHIVETRLSHHLARHFSIFNDLRLRSSDRIDKFFQMLSESSRVSLLKVLDLEECQCFGGKKQSYLKVICSKMLLLKYLSLKGTDVTKLPTEINNLRELEVLDIRGTKVPESATINVLLLKLKRLLAGGICLSPSSNIGSSAIDCDLSSVHIPENIEKMVNMEVLSYVKAHSSQDLKDIGRLCLLRKLGVVIQDKETQLNNLLQTINDLQESLRSLSITTPISWRDGTPSEGELQAYTSSRRRFIRHPPKLLECLSITGTTQKGHLLPLFVKHGNNKLAKVTLSNILLNQDNLKDLAKLPKLQYLRLRNIGCTDSMLTFNKDYEFKYLKYLLIEGSNLTCIVFENRGACELQKLVLSFTNIASVHGADTLQKLEELELNNNRSGRLLSSFDNADQIAKLTLRGTLLEEADLQILAKKPKMRCLVLLDKSCAVSQITFNKYMFLKLNLLTVDCSCVTEIIFNSGSAPKLEKIIWSSFKLFGIDKLPRLKELEFNGDHIQTEVEETIQKSNNRLQLKHNQPDNQDEANGDVMEDDDSPRCSFCWKNQV